MYIVIEIKSQDQRKKLVNDSKIRGSKAYFVPDQFGEKLAQQVKEDELKRLSKKLAS